MISLTTALAILQQSEYDFAYFADWYRKHHHDTLEIAPEKMTLKLKLITFLYHLFPFGNMRTRLQTAVLLLQPGEQLSRWLIVFRATRKLRARQKQGLQVVAVAGSYGKTSTKQTLAHLLSPEISLLITPESINTPIGISQIINRKLTKAHRLFVVELGEYYPGDILKLAKFVKPNFGILTPVGRQHLERFKTFEAVVDTMHELVAYFAQEPHKVIVSEKYQSLFPEKNLTYYGTAPASDLRIIDSKVSLAGTEFTIQTNKTEFTHIFSPLFGTHQAVNLLPSIWLAEQLQLSLPNVLKQIPSLPYIPHRLEPQFVQNNVLILDNGYNTNPDSVTESLAVLNQLKQARRILVTLGFVELGTAAEKIHYAFGQELAKQVDVLGLIDSPNATAIQQGFLEHGGTAKNIVIGKNQEDVVQQLSGFIIPNSVILFEGGYRELYT